MNDVIPESGGFLIVSVDPFGYIYDEYNGWMIHRETRDLHQHSLSFTEAKSKLPTHDELCLLELTPRGGGMAMWMREEQISELSRRRDRWKGCYGSWPIHTLTI